MNVQGEARTPRCIEVSWSASTDNDGVSGYKVYRDGVLVGTTATTVYLDCGLEPGSAHSYTIVAFDTFGNTSPPSDPPVVANSLSAVGIADAKRLPDGDRVGLVEKCVTAVFPDCFYIEEADRSIGIRIAPVVMPIGLAVGTTVDVGGTMQTTADGERQIAQAAAMVAGETTVKPVGMNNAAVGGADWFYDGGTGAGQRGIRGSSGLNNIGLLVRVWGRVAADSLRSFFVDDGAGVKVKVILPPSGVGLPDPLTFVGATGISSCYSDGSDLLPCVLVRDPSDLTPF